MKMRSLIAVICLVSYCMCQDKCEYEGRHYAKGEIWSLHGKYMMKCEDDGAGGLRTTITHCLTPGGEKVLVGTKKYIKGAEYACKRGENGAVQFGWNSDFGRGAKYNQL
ncbi:hypothetical protein AB6A40_008398 [Gnathostoma spinigerum]|uniref:Abnormal cell migration protein 18-like fibronectin type I domain-containing protein n=1 Tax=Gnathostoma spinigerum TaxID=75299 RepID=A0ABD6ENZ2_9BILA